MDISRSNVSATAATGPGFRGRERLIALLDEAVQARDAAAVTEAVKRGLIELMQAGELELPPVCRETCADHYRRRELYRSDRYGYLVIAMSWAPSQGTGVHDHAGLWCVEGVCAGCLEVQQYDLDAQDGERYRLQRRNDHIARTGSAGALIPPFEYHRIVNTDAAQPAVSLHVYERAMTMCNVFEPVGEGWFRRTARQLALDS